MNFFLALQISNDHEVVLIAEIMAAGNKTVLEKKSVIFVRYLSK